MPRLHVALLHAIAIRVHVLLALDLVLVLASVAAAADAVPISFAYYSYSYVDPASTVQSRRAPISRLRVQSSSLSQEDKSTEIKPPIPTSTPWRSLGAQAAFATPLFPKEQPLSIPTNVTGVDLLLPDFDVLFSRIAEISPLSKQILEGSKMRGFADLDMVPDTLTWKTVEKNAKRLVHEVDRIDNFEGHHTPLIRLRSRLEGPELDRGGRFSSLLTDQEYRSKWDPNCAVIHEMYLAEDMNDIQLVMGGAFGTCIRFGLGYCQTKKNIVSPREQLTLCGLQEFPCRLQDGSKSTASIVWGVELEDDQNHLFPPGERLIRSRSHIFSNAIVPTGKDTFDCEYVLQLEIGNFPEWLARPVLITICKDLFRYAQKHYDLTGELAS